MIETVTIEKIITQKGGFWSKEKYYMEATITYDDGKIKRYVAVSTLSWEDWFNTDTHRALGQTDSIRRLIDQACSFRRFKILTGYKD